MPGTSIRETVLIAVFSIVVIANGIDIKEDLSHGVTPQHVFVEISVVLLSIFCIAWLLLALRQQRLTLSALRQEHKEVGGPHAKPEGYVLDGRRELRQVVARQFTDWELTRSECNVGWLLLKGLSLKEISAVRETQEKTVRQQASSIYQKSGVNGRHAFSAWFIEDIL